MTLIIPPDIAERARAFTGRSWVLDAVSDWVENGKQRFLLIMGKPRSGKTALAAWLAGIGPPPAEAAAAGGLGRIRGAWGACHFCAGRERAGSLHPGRFAQALAQQLTDRFDDYASLVLQRIDPTIVILRAGRIDTNPKRQRG
ncbi:MAG TPA: hypothetical protein VH682_23480 [Gemmataceae bacterium]